MGQYNALIKCLHGFIAIAVILQLIIGYFFDDIFVHFNANFFMTVHKSLGLTLFFVIPLLIVVCIVSGKVQYPPKMPVVQKVLAKLVHWTMYVSVFTMAFSGVIPNQLYHTQWQYFYLFEVPNILAKNPQVASNIFALHFYVAPILLGLVIAHILAAIYHQAVVKDNVMKKMF